MTTAAAFTPVKIATTNVEASGVRPSHRRMLGSAGFLATGKGAFMKMESQTWKTFMLYPQSQSGTDITTGEVEIQGAMELDTVDEVPNTKFIVLATLDASTRSFSMEAPWPYIRCVVKTADSVLMQVGLYGIGL